jgi:glutamate mutase epsilon subunit
MDNLLQVVLAVIGSNAVFAFITFLIKRKDDKDDRFKELDNKIENGLEEREEVSKERYEEYQENINELREVIIKLSEDAEERKHLTQCMASSLMALSHDKLVHLGKTYQRRGAIT